MHLKIKSETFASSHDRITNTKQPPAIHSEKTGENIEMIIVTHWTTGSARL